MQHPHILPNCNGRETQPFYMLASIRQHTLSCHTKCKVVPQYVPSILNAMFTSNHVYIRYSQRWNNLAFGLNNIHTCAGIYAESTTQHHNNVSSQFHWSAGSSGCICQTRYYPVREGGEILQRKRKQYENDIYTVVTVTTECQVHNETMNSTAMMWNSIRHIIYHVLISPIPEHQTTAPSRQPDTSASQVHTNSGEDNHSNMIDGFDKSNMCPVKPNPLYKGEHYMGRTQ